MADFKSELKCPFCEQPARLGDYKIYHAFGDGRSIELCESRPMAELIRSGKLMRPGTPKEVKEMALMEHDCGCGSPYCTGCALGQQKDKEALEKDGK